MDTQIAQKSGESTGAFTPWLVGLVGLAFVGYIAFGLLSGADWNPTALIKFGESNGALREYAEEHFGDVVLAGGEGHDGKFFFIQASDPFYLEPDENAFLLDRPTYRAQRMLYPTVAGGLGMFSPGVTAWMLVILNIVAVGAGTYLTSRVAMVLGLSPLFGLAFLINPGVFVSSVIDTAEVFAMVFLMAGILLAIERKHTSAAVLFTLSALSRETMLLCAIGWVFFELVHSRKVRWEMSLPFLAVGAWWLYLRVRIGNLADGVQDVRALGAPFEGLANAFQDWVSRPEKLDDLIVGLALVGIFVFFAYLAFTRRSLIPLMAAGFGLVGILMVDEVWISYFDSSRALTPLITLFFLAVPFSLRPHSGRIV